MDPDQNSFPNGDRGSDVDHSLDVERDSDVPISTQIYWQLAYQIESGRLQPGERVSPVRELGAALRVNPNTIRAVYRRLADNGYVVSRHGAGTIVADRSTHRRRPEALGGIVSEMPPRMPPPPSGNGRGGRCTSSSRSARRPTRATTPNA
jgi:DNA-binding transcriptional regulator YhcF (GntR family)